MVNYSSSRLTGTPGGPKITGEYPMKNIEKLKILKEVQRRKQEAIYKENFDVFAKDHIKIVTKDSTQGFVPFKLNDAQKHINKALEDQIKETGKVRAIILKARQQGISTYCAARVFWKTYYNAHTRSVVMAHDGPTSEALFTMGRNLIDNMDPVMRPKYEKSNAREIKFAHNQAGYRLYTAGSPEAGRGTTPTVAHLSEVAFWQHDEKILAGLFQGISQYAGTEVILESTANGASGEFFRLWRGAVDGSNGYIPVFIPWFLTSEYTTPAPKGFERSEEEDTLAEEHGLTDGQLYWRRLKIAESGERKFQQEYPAKPEEAFLVSGSNVFDPKIVHDMKATAAISRREFNSESGYFDEYREGNLNIWKYPKFDEHFVIGADVALGARQDYSVATIFNTNNELCAMYRTNEMDPGSFGDLLFYLGRYYNNALLAVESNSIGNTTLDRLLRMGYVNLYYETKIAMMRTEDTDRLGFRTTASSKPRIIGHLKRMVEDLDISLPSDVVIQELKDYVQTDSGKTEALQGCHDDCVISIAIAMEILRTHADRLTNTKVSWKNRVGNLQFDNTRWI